MSLNRTMNIGANGLNVAALGNSISAHNATNAETEGYSRQQVVQRSRPIHLGGGVFADRTQRVVDRFVDRRLTVARSIDGEASARADILAALDRIFTSEEGALGEAFDDFESSIAAFSEGPAEPASRVAMLSAAERLATTFNQSAEALNQARREADDGITREVAQINAYVKQIADLNRQIKEAVTGAQDAASLMDTRDQLIREVASRVPVTVLPEGQGGMILMLGSSRILASASGHTSELGTTLDAEGHVRVVMSDGFDEDVTDLITSGSIRGYLDARDGSIADATAALDQLAHDVVTAYNDAHSAGFGTDGVSGRNLFEPLTAVESAAGNLAVSADIAGHPERLSAAEQAGLSGDNRVALRLAALSSENIASGGKATATQAYAQLIGQAGTAVKAAIGEADHASLTLQQAQNVRDSISGVSTDEEMINLMRYQRAYQASLRVIETADSLLAELMSMR